MKLKLRLQGIEMLDEIEEWNLIQSHYALDLAITDSAILCSLSLDCLQ